MADAVAIRFTSDQRRGVGTSFECDTKVGPFGLTDHMVVTDWDEGHSMAIEHVGIVRGAGRLSVATGLDGRTRLSWDEELHFPWWLAGPLGGWAATFVLRPTWRGNLRRLKSQVEPSPP